MAQPNYYGHRELSPHIEVEMLGFRSSMAQMQAFGWEFVVEVPVARYDHVMVLANHREARFAASGLLNTAHIEERRCLVLNRLAATEHFYINASHVPNFERINAFPERADFTSLAVANIFRPWKETVKEIIVEPQTVAEILEMAQRHQAVELKDIRNRNRRREAQQEQVAAQILTFG